MILATRMKGLVIKIDAMLNTLYCKLWPFVTTAVRIDPSAVSYLSVSNIAIIIALNGFS
jgi:hypothetical protein